MQANKAHATHGKLGDKHQPQVFAYLLRSDIRCE
jgi:hypothetical protein